MIAVIIGIGISLMILERVFPDQKLPSVRGWWLRVVILNLFQLGIVFLGGLTWQKWFHDWSLLNLRDSLSPLLGGLLTYFLLTFLYYWWHRTRHDVNVLWLAFHQVHHSPSRIETITSFYKDKSKYDDYK